MEALLVIAVILIVSFAVVTVTIQIGIGIMTLIYKNAGFLAFSAIALAVLFVLEVSQK